MTERTETPVKATATSARVVDALLDFDGATVTELDEHLELSKSSIHNHLETLETLGFVVRDTWQYRVSLEYLHIGGVARRQHPLYDAGVPIVRRLADSSGLVASLVTLENSRAVCLSTSIGGKSETAVIEIGDVLPLHCTAAGKALLAALPSDQSASILENGELEKKTDKTRTTREALEEEFQTIESRGLAFDDEEWRSGTRGVADAIPDEDGGVLGAICVTSSAEAMSGKRFRQDIPGLVRSSSSEIRKALRSA